MGFIKLKLAFDSIKRRLKSYEFQVLAFKPELLAHQLKRYELESTQQELGTLSSEIESLGEQIELKVADFKSAHKLGRWIPQARISEVESLIEKMKALVSRRRSLLSEYERLKLEMQKLADSLGNIGSWLREHKNIILNLNSEFQAIYDKVKERMINIPLYSDEGSSSLLVRRGHLLSQIKKEFPDEEIVKIALELGAGMMQTLPCLLNDHQNYILIDTNNANGTPITKETHPNAIVTVEEYHKFVLDIMKKEEILCLLIHVASLLELYSFREDKNDERNKLLLSLHQRTCELSFGEIEQVVKCLNRITQNKKNLNNSPELKSCVLIVRNALLHVCSLKFNIIFMKTTLTPDECQKIFPIKSIPKDLGETLCSLEPVLKSNFTFWESGLPENEEVTVEEGRWQTLGGLHDPSVTL